MNISEIVNVAVAKIITVRLINFLQIKQTRISIFKVIVRKTAVYLRINFNSIAIYFSMLAHFNESDKIIIVSFEALFGTCVKNTPYTFIRFFA